jgi:transcriptional regulator with XRE-family HTH domain
MVHQREQTPEDLFGRKMYAARRRRQQTQEELAREMANYGVELHSSAIAKMEQRDVDRPRAIRLNEAVAAAAALNEDLARMVLTPEHEDLARVKVRLTQARAQHAAAVRDFDILAEEWKRLTGETLTDRLPGDHLPISGTEGTDGEHPEET